MTCSTCGAALASGAPWCGQCFAPVAGPAPVPARAVVQQELPLTPTYTRWRKTDTAFGPVGRVLWTLAVLLVAAMSVFSQNPFAIVPLCFVLPPLVLRSVWSRSRMT